MTGPRAAAALAAGLLAGLAACAPMPPAGAGGAAESVPVGGWPPPSHWSGEPIHPRLRAEAAAIRPDLGPDWVEGRLETISCLDFKLEGLAMAGALDLFPAEVALARADRRRALRELMGGLQFDGDLSLRDYRDHVRRIEEALLRRGRPPSAEVRNLPC